MRVWAVYSAQFNSTTNAVKQALKLMQNLFQYNLLGHLANSFPLGEM